jgi:hypothetical protein
MDNLPSDDGFMHDGLILVPSPVPRAVDARGMPDRLDAPRDDNLLELANAIRQRLVVWSSSSTHIMPPERLSRLVWSAGALTSEGFVGDHFPR